MGLEEITNIIVNLGFPIACVIALAIFIWRFVKSNREDNLANMKQIQDRCQAREDKLYNELAECHKINSKAIQTIAVYAEKLDNIQKDVCDIKTDLVVIKTRQNDSMS